MSQSIFAGSSFLDDPKTSMHLIRPERSIFLLSIMSEPWILLSVFRNV